MTGGKELAAEREDQGIGGLAEPPRPLDVSDPERV